MRPGLVIVVGTGEVARRIADRLSEAGFTVGAPPTGSAAAPQGTGDHVLVTAFDTTATDPQAFDAARRALAALPPGSRWLDATHRPVAGDDFWFPAAVLGHVTHVPVPIADIRGTLVASPPAVLDLHSRHIVDTIVGAAADLVLPTHSAAVPIASLEVGLAEPPAPLHRPRPVPAPCPADHSPAAPIPPCSDTGPDLHLL
ncbi:hypothetical protein [Kitasatospora cinereorecta]|uniref:Pyrroline-5-carboxylate reductase catalytic N-terminal domain-containing protein n=1 Tax=Kitasatospora cinereorecta TaxID=285560 RepID=A0ABW0VPQ6_9ACTN